MKSKRVTGLVSAGGIGQSFVARLPRLLAAVGPVKATSFRVARRIVNMLRAGHAVKDYAAFDKCDLIWIVVPEATLEKVIRDLAAYVRAPGKMIVLCGSVRDSYWPGVLRARGARLASLNAIEREPRTLVAEGHPDVLRELRHLAAAEKSKLIEIRPASKPLFLAGVHLSTNLMLPWIAAAIDSLRMAGFSRADATGVVEALGARALRAYGKAGHKAWRRTAVDGLHHAVESDLETIRSADPHLAALYQTGIEQALGYFENP
jgi:hypothetical protein